MTLARRSLKKGNSTLYWLARLCALYTTAAKVLQALRLLDYPALGVKLLQSGPYRPQSIEVLTRTRQTVSEESMTSFMSNMKRGVIQYSTIIAARKWSVQVIDDLDI